jgi:hypothetical protein
MRCIGIRDGLQPSQPGGGTNWNVVPEAGRPGPSLTIGRILAHDRQNGKTKWSDHLGAEVGVTPWGFRAAHWWRKPRKILRRKSGSLPRHQTWEASLCFFRPEEAISPARGYDTRLLREESRACRGPCPIRPERRRPEGSPGAYRYRARPVCLTCRAGAMRR